MFFLSWFTCLTQITLIFSADNVAEKCGLIKPYLDGTSFPEGGMKKKEKKKKKVSAAVFIAPHNEPQVGRHTHNNQNTCKPKTYKKKQAQPSLGHNSQ